MKQFIIVQGPLTYYQDIIQYYSGISNVIVSTSTSEVQEAVIHIHNSKLNVTYADMLPDIQSNINRQCYSTSMGLMHAKLMGATHALKLRSDMFISDIEKTMEILSHKEKISFLCWHSNGYLVDYMNYGPIDDMIKFWALPRTMSSDFAEKILLDNFTKNKNISPVTFENIKSNVDFFIDDLVKSNIHIIWEKYGIDVTEYTKDPTYLY